MDISDLVQSLADLSDATKEAEEEFKNRDNSQDFSSLLQGMISSSGSKDCIMKIAPYDFAIVIVGFYSYYLCNYLKDNNTKNLYDIKYSQEFSSLMFDGLSKGFDNFMKATQEINDATTYFKFKDEFIKVNEGQKDNIGEIFNIFATTVGESEIPDESRREELIEQLGTKIGNFLSEANNQSSYGRRRKRRSS